VRGWPRVETADLDLVICQDRLAHTI
jgi:hypothetical protein